MSQVAPPLPPIVSVDDEPPLKRVQRHLLRIGLAVGTVCATAWCYQIHVGLGIAATFLAKHILVALLAAGLRLPVRDVKE
ncbi:MAG: hypothetical protein FJ303_14365 [Planctomycetes bacterium]|nr:hypothetical protein [Planctomycetota bacterium]